MTNIANILNITFSAHTHFVLDYHKCLTPQSAYLYEKQKRKEKKYINFIRENLSNKKIPSKKEILYCINKKIEIDQFFINDIFNIQNESDDLILKISLIELNKYTRMNIKTEQIKHNVNYLCSILTSPNFNEEYYLFNTSTKLILEHFNAESINQDIWISYEIINTNLKEVEK